MGLPISNLRSLLLALVSTAVLFTACNPEVPNASHKEEVDLRIYSQENPWKKYTLSKLIRELKKEGFIISKNADLVKPFKKQFYTDHYKIFRLISVYHKTLSLDLIKENPTAGIFMPMSIGAYQRRGDENIHISTLTAFAQSKILGNQKSSVLLHDIESHLKRAFLNAMPKADITLETVTKPTPSGKLLVSFDTEIDIEEWDDTREEAAIILEESFKPAGFVVANFTDVDALIGESSKEESPFDFYDTYSICKLKVIYNVALTQPQASAFAPCSLMMYKVHDEDKMVFGFPSVYNWIDSANITNRRATKELLKAQRDFETILKDITL